MNNEIENKLLQMFVKLGEENKYDRGSTSDIEMFKDNASQKIKYTQEFAFGKGIKEYKYVATIIVDIAGNIIEEKCEEI